MFVGKMELVTLLAKQNGYRDFLEISTETTGGQFHKLDRTRFRHCERLLYRCPVDYDDGSPVHYRSQSDDIDSCLAHMGSKRFDIGLVDPYHSYEASKRDMTVMFDRLRGDGMMIVHDCLPPDATIASRRFRAGAWCGVTYRAFLDFVLDRDDLEFCTVDTDYGCGIVRKLPALRAIQRLTDRLRGRRKTSPVVLGWRARRTDDEAFAYYEAHRAELLSLVTIDELIQRHEHTDAVLKLALP